MSTTKTSVTCKKIRRNFATATSSASCRRLLAAHTSNRENFAMATKSEIAANQAPGTAPVSLSKEEILRYSRHLIMPEVGMEGQLKLKQAKVLCIGTGGLGAPLGLYLAAAGVGRIGLVDFDTVDSTNLQRQILFGTKDVGRPKIAAASDRLRDLNPDIQIDTF